MARALTTDSASVFALSYLGDALYETWCREQVLARFQTPAEVSRRVIGLVRCQTQSQLVQTLLPQLSEAELAVFRRGRNLRPASVPKHATVKEYRAATGFECLVGFWHLEAHRTRLTELLALPEAQEVLAPFLTPTSLSKAS